MKGIMVILAIIISIIIFISSSHSRDNQEMCMYFNGTQISCGLFQIEYEDGVLSTFDNQGNINLFKIKSEQETLYYFSYPFYKVEMRLKNGIIESRSEKEDRWLGVKEDEEGQ